MMKCSACGKEVDEGSAQCPWCGNETAKSQLKKGWGKLIVSHRVTFVETKKLTGEELLRQYRRMEIIFTVVLVLFLCGGIYNLATFNLEGIVGCFMVVFVCIPAIRYYDRKRKG